MRRLIPLAGMMLALLPLAAQEPRGAYRAEKEKLPREVAPQPIRFSHRAHAAAGAECLDCHVDAREKSQAGIPQAERCMLCHTAIATGNAEVRKLAAFEREGKPIEWVRLYRLPNFVFFSHKEHLAAGATCERCHGPVAERDALAQEVSTRMPACMNCHAEREAPNECFLCHDLGQ